MQLTFSGPEKDQTTLRPVDVHFHPVRGYRFDEKNRGCRVNFDPVVTIQFQVFFHVCVNIFHFLYKRRLLAMP